MELAREHTGLQQKAAPLQIAIVGMGFGTGRGGGGLSDNLIQYMCLPESFVMLSFRYIKIGAGHVNHTGFVSILFYYPVLL